MEINHEKCRRDSYDEKIVHTSNMIVYVIIVYFLRRYISKEKVKSSPR